MTNDGWHCPDQVFDGARLRKGLALKIEDGRVSDMAPVVPQMAAVTVPGVITPGFVDLQVNGGGDCLLNDEPTVRGMERIAAAHHAEGTVAILPTLITDAPDLLDRAAAAAIAARGRPGLIGLHIEGPHISHARRGTHLARHIRPLDRRTIDAVRHLRAEGVPVMITLAPEAADLVQIAELAATGAVVSIGHSDATAAEAQSALAAGARCFTHLFNAMSPMQGRAPGVVGAAINSTAHAGIICDGIHVADEMVALALRARPVADRTFLVSDAMPTVGGSDRFVLYGQTIKVEDGRLVNAEGSLAGAHVTLAASVARVIGVLGLPPKTALRMAITVPARLMGREDLTRITGRKTTDLLRLDDGWTPAPLVPGA